MPAMTIRIQFEHLRPYMSIVSDHYKFPAKEQKAFEKKFGPNAHHVNFRYVLHYRNLFLYQGNKIIDRPIEEWGEKPMEKERIMVTDYSKFSGTDWCDCCDPHFPILNGTNDHLFKVKSEPIDTDMLMHHRQIYEHFRRCKLLDISEYEQFLSKDDKESIDKELEISNLFNQITHNPYI